MGGDVEVNMDLLAQLKTKFRKHFGVEAAVAAYAPGRVEVLGNHTDYNEGFVLSAAINFGTFFVCAPSADASCRLVAGDIGEECRFSLADVAPAKAMSWANYVKGVLAGFQGRARLAHGFIGMFLGDVPLGAGLSSSAALEMCSGLALAKLYKLAVPPLDLAKIGQAAEHKYAGVKCGLLDQISSLFGQEDALVMSDFRTLQVRNVPLGADACFLVCNTAVKHSLVESEYNERRERCEQAAHYFASVLTHPVTHLRDVSWAELEKHRGGMEAVVAKRATHVVGENTRVLQGEALLGRHDLAAFGKLMFQSHETSRTQFENSCPELDVLVDAAAQDGEALGARLSGGGFGGSVVVLVRAGAAQGVGQRLAAAYSKAFGHPCATMVIRPSAGGRVL
jgi:galactokinase